MNFPTRLRAPGAAQPTRIPICALRVPLTLLALCSALFGAVDASQAAFGDRVLRQGSRGSDVKQLQQILTRLGVPTDADGAYGSGTARNVRIWERRVRGKIDGIVTRGQARTMIEMAAGRPVPAKRTGDSRRSGKQFGSYELGDRYLKQGMSGSDVEELQEILTGFGIRTTADGEYGGGTTRSVTEYETRVQGIVDGVVSRGQGQQMRDKAESGEEIPEGAGGAPSDPPASPGRYVFPVRGPHNFGQAGARFGAGRSGHAHRGQDIFAKAGTPVASVTSGSVHRIASQASGAGNYIVIYGDDGFDYVYMHFQSPATATVGAKVNAGQIIGRVGCTGSCSGDHLHFEIWTQHWYDGGSPMDPLPKLRQWDAVS